MKGFKQSHHEFIFYIVVHVLYVEAREKYSTLDWHWAHGIGTRIQTVLKYSTFRFYTHLIQEC